MAKSQYFKLDKPGQMLFLGLWGLFCIAYYAIRYALFSDTVGGILVQLAIALGSFLILSLTGSVAFVTVDLDNKEVELSYKRMGGFVPDCLCLGQTFPLKTFKGAKVENSGCSGQKVMLHFTDRDSICIMPLWSPFPFMDRYLHEYCDRIDTFIKTKGKSLNP